MNREKLAIELVTVLARLIVGHPDKLKAEVKEFGGRLTLILTAVASDTGRLVGPRGAMHQALQRIGGEIALCNFDLIVNEPTMTAPVVQFKTWDGSIKPCVEQMVKTVFNGSANVLWETAGTVDLVEIVVASGFDGELLERFGADLKLVCHAIGRAHRRDVKVCVAEEVRR